MSSRARARPRWSGDVDVALARLGSIAADTRDASAADGRLVARSRGASPSDTSQQSRLGWQAGNAA